MIKKNKTQRKIIFLLAISLIMVLMLTACFWNDSVQETTFPPDTSEEENPESVNTDVTVAPNDETDTSETDSSVTEAHEHTVTIDAAVTATCTESGKTEGSHCSECGEIIVEQQVVPATGHTKEIRISVKATCTQDGYFDYVCSECGYTYDREVVSAQGHNYENGMCTVCGNKKPESSSHTHQYTTTVTKSATCTEDGTNTHSCTCGYSYTTAITAPGHNFRAWVADVIPTDIATGNITRVCATDNTHIETFTLPILNKTDYTYKIVTAPCEAEGVERYTYTKDSQDLTFDVVLTITGHAYGQWAVTTAPTKSSTGLLTKVCANDSNHKETFTLPVLNNTDYAYSVTSPEDCENDGKGRYSYAKDGQTFDFDVVINKLGHSYSAWSVTTAPTKSTVGTLNRTCPNNNAHIDSVELPALNRTDYTYSVLTPAKCESSGTERYSFAKDGQTFDFDVNISQLNHKYGNWVVKTAPTDQNTGTITKTCENDPTHTVNDTLPILNGNDYTVDQISSTVIRYTIQKEFQDIHVDVTVPESYSVTFVDDKDAVIKKMLGVLAGSDVTPPTAPSKSGETFIGWSGNYTNITENRTIKAVYSGATNAICLDTSVSGNTLTVKLVLRGNVKFSSFAGSLHFDSSILTYSESDFASNLVGLDDCDDGMYSFNCSINGEDNIESVSDVTIVTLHFNINTNVNTRLYIDYVDINAIDDEGIDENPIEYSLIDGFVNIN